MAHYTIKGELPPRRRLQLGYAALLRTSSSKMARRMLRKRMSMAPMGKSWRMPADKSWEPAIQYRPASRIVRQHQATTSPNTVVAKSERELVVIRFVA